MGFFFQRSRAANSEVRDRIWPNFELMQALMFVIITCKYNKDPIKNSRENVMTPFSPLGERGGIVVESLTPEREVGSSIPTPTVLCPWAKTHLLPEKYW